MIKAADSAADLVHGAGGDGHGTARSVVRVRVLRQDVAGGESYWERFEVSQLFSVSGSILQLSSAIAREKRKKR
jgi:hypothetical protein